MTRVVELRSSLLELKRHVTDDVNKKLNEFRESGSLRYDGQNDNFGDAVEGNSALELARIHVNRDNDTLRRIDEALRRLESGRYGYCFDCDNEISEARLEALPFAVRCKNCEELREKPA